MGESCRAFVLQVELEVGHLERLQVACWVAATLRICLSPYRSPPFLVEGQRI